MEQLQMIHGGDRLGAALESGKAQEELLDFSANINPMGMPSGIRKAFLESCEEILHYPDPLCRRLREALAKEERTASDKVLCGNGGADLIYRLVFALKPGEALVTAPCFAEYEEALKQAGSRIRYFRLPADMELGEDFTDAVTEGLDLIFLCNPNNPTGLLTRRELLVSVLKKAGDCGARVCVDECFLDFVRERDGYSLTGMLDRYPNLIILKSFTKLYAIPGLRLGYVLCADRELLARMEKAGQPWPVSGPAQEAGLAALKEIGFREQTLELVDRERGFLKKGLEEMGCFVYEGRANFLCFRVQGEEALYEKLLSSGILIRRCGNYRGLSTDTYRAAVRSHEENIKFLKAMRQIVSTPV